MTSISLYNSIVHGGAGQFELRMGASALAPAAGDSDQARSAKLLVSHSQQSIDGRHRPLRRAARRDLACAS